MSSERSMLQPGRLLRRAREDAELTQAQLAAKAGVATSTLSQYEKGRRQPSLAVLERLLATAGVQLHLELQPLWQRIDAAIDELAALTPRERWQRIDVRLPDMARQLGRVPHVVVGLPAAFLHGAPVPVREWEIVLTPDALEELQRQLPVPSLIPLAATPGRWILPSGGGWVRTIEVDELPDSVAVDLEGVVTQVLPLLALEDSDPYVGRVLERLRMRRARDGVAETPG